MRNTWTGAVVSCTEATAARLGRGWEPVTPDPEPTPEPAATPAPKRTRKRAAAAPTS